MEEGRQQYRLPSSIFRVRAREGRSTSGSKNRASLQPSYTFGGGALRWTSARKMEITSHSPSSAAPRKKSIAMPG